MITYAQNFEDVMLARLFADSASGFYVDIGAGDPTTLSVTRHFYELGWRGINVEPIRANWERFVKERPRDINLNVAIAGSPGRREFCEVVDNDALSSLDPARISDLAAGGASIRRYEVECVTGDSLFAQAPAEVDFLKIDVEGSEQEVLASIDLARHRPKALVIEATGFTDRFPGWSNWAPQALARWMDWEPYVLQAGYVFAHFDGLNRFYLRDDLRHLSTRLSVPPGVFDFIVPDMQEDLHRKRREAEAAFAAALAGRETALAGSETALAEVRGLLEQSETTLAEVRGLLEQGRTALEEKEGAVAALQRDAAAHQEEIHARDKALQDKEAVIRELRDALTAYKSAFSVFGIFLGPLRGIVSVAGSVSRLPRNLFAPRLGVLNQHVPLELVLPAHYHRPIALDRAPRISLVTPSYGQAGFIGRTLASVLGQKYPDLEYFVQDGGSRDGTVEILEQHAPRLAGWDSRADSGQSQAINRGFERTTGEIMGWLNSDDMLLPGALASVAAYFEAHPEVDVVYGHRILIDENDRQIGRWMLPAHDDEVLKWADFVPQETLFWRRRIWDKAGGRIDESFRFAMDWDLLMRFRAAGARFARLDRFLGAFRIHPHQKTSAVINEVGFQEMNRIRERELGRVPSGTEVRKAVAPYILRHVLTDLGWRIRNRLGLRA